jgi:hypothetical protein
MLVLCIVLAQLRVGAQVIQLDGRPFNCDSAYTNYEMGWCARHLLDSATASMHSLVGQLQAGLEVEAAEWRTEMEQGTDEEVRRSAKDEVEFLVQARAHLDSAQSAFEHYARHQSALVGDLYGFGRERTVAELMSAYGSVAARNEELKSLIDRYGLR